MTRAAASQRRCYGPVSGARVRAGNLGGKDNYTLRTQSLGYAWQREGRGLVQAELVKEAASPLRMWREGDYICVENDTDMFYEAYFTAHQSWLEVPKMTKIAPHGVSYWLVKETEHNFGEMALDGIIY